MNLPLAIDLFSGLGGWTEGLLAAGFCVVGFDIERHMYGESKYPADLVIQDILTVHGSQFRDAALIVASPPCQNYSYLAMPWSRSSDPENSKAAKALRKKWETEGPDNRLFDACFRIQREAIEATYERCPQWPVGMMHGGGCGLCGGTGVVYRHIPLIVENVRGAVPWVGREAAKFGSFYLWGDVAQIGNRVIAGRDLADIRAGRGRFGMGVVPEAAVKVDGFRFDGSGRSFQTASVEATGRKQLHSRGDNQTCGKHRMGLGAESVIRLLPETGIAKYGSGSNARKAASALIAKIPFALSEYIGRVHFPQNSG